MEMAEGLLDGGSRCRPLARRRPVFDRLVGPTCLSPVMSDEFGHLACNFGMRPAQGVGNMLVELLAGASQHALIGGIAKQLVSEPVLDRLGIT